MAGEQPVFLNLSPEESLTNVHERLRQIPEHRIVLIVPQQTQLRSLISWRLLRGYARDLNKEILVISADRQIRSVAKEAQFRVAESLAVPPSSKGRGGNTGRSATGTPRGSGNRGAKGLSRFRQTESAQQNRTSFRPPTNGRDQRMKHAPLPEPVEEQETDELHISNLGEDDELENPNWAVSPSFDSDQYDTANRYERPIDFRIASNSPLRPVELTPEPEEEELDSLPYDYEQSQKIFHAASQQDEGSEEDDTSVLPGPDRMVEPHDRMVPPTSEEQTVPENIPQAHGRSSALPPPLSPPVRALEDPFDVGDDFQPSPLSEQRGAAPVFPFDDGEDVVDISQYPTTDIPVHGEIEDMGDVEMEGLPPLVDDLPPPSSWEEPELEQDIEQEETHDLPLAYHTPRRSGQLSPAAREMAANTFNVAKPEEEKAIEDQTTRVIPPALSLPDAVAGPGANRVASGEPAAGVPPPVAPIPTRQKAPRPVELQPNRATARPLPANRRFPASPSTRGPRPAPRSRKPLSVTRRKQSRVAPVLLAIAILLLVGIILFVFPSADVTVTLAAQSYSWPVVVSASTSQNLVKHTVPLYNVPFTASVTQNGQASGANTPGGTVQFTNNGSQQVLIPNGTVVSTTSNVSFVTSAEAVAPAGGSVYVPVQAQNSGSSGIVAANTITNIPGSSISQIAQASNLTPSAVTLTVTNANPTSGADSATTVTSADVSKLQATATTLLYRELQTWLTQKQAQGNILARPMQESQLPPSETVKANPAAGQVASNGTFSEAVSLSILVPFVHSSDLQAQAVAQYQQLSNASTLPKGTVRPPKGYEPVAGQPVQLQPESCTSSSKSSSANASPLCFRATGAVALPVSAQQVQNLVNGKQVKVVRAQLPSSKTGLPGIKAVKVAVSPSFWPWMPFWTQRISVHFTADIPQK